MYTVCVCIFVHKYLHIILLCTSHRCEVFRAMFADSALSDGSPLVLADIKPLVFMAILEYIYTNCCSLSTSSVRYTVLLSYVRMYTHVYVCTSVAISGFTYVCTCTICQQLCLCEFIVHKRIHLETYVYKIMLKHEYGNDNTYKQWYSTGLQ